MESPAAADVENRAAEERASDPPEPVTEAVPEVIHHPLVGESTMPADGEYVTEAAAEEPQEKS
jgi:hypothetical protein